MGVFWRTERRCSPMKLGVVIPYFQYERGILANAISSIIAQKLPDYITVVIVIVDDDSPVPATDELQGIVLPTRFTCEIVVQENGGPGAARNRALDVLERKNVDWLAFVDSDDVWKPDHLSVALAALGDDGDFYFCDHTRFDIASSYFDDREFADALHAAPLLPSTSTVNEAIRQWDGASAASNFCKHYLCQTSTVVARWQAICQLRFDTELKSAGEDALYWIDCAMKSRTVRFSMVQHVHCGRGINIYNGNFGWDTIRGRDRFGYLMLLYIKIAKRRPHPRKSSQRVEMAYAYLSVRSLFRGQMPNRSLFWSLLKASPAAVARLPLRLLQYAMMRKQIDW